MITINHRSTAITLAVSVLFTIVACAVIACGPPCPPSQMRQGSWGSPVCGPPDESGTAQGKEDATDAGAIETEDGGA